MSNPVRRRDEGLSRVSVVTRWSIVGALAATAGIGAVVANAQPGRASTNTSAVTSTDDGTGDGTVAPGDGAVTTLPPTTVVAGSPRSRSAPAPAVPAAPRRRRQTPTTTSRGS